MSKLVSELVIEKTGQSIFFRKGTSRWAAPDEIVETLRMGGIAALKWFQVIPIMNRYRMVLVAMGDDRITAYCHLKPDAQLMVLNAGTCPVAVVITAALHENDPPKQLSVIEKAAVAAGRLRRR